MATGDLRLGMIGVSEGNGHPFSFAAIVNGFDPERFAEAGWPVIHDYLKRRRADEFGFTGVRVTCAWTQDPATSARLVAACAIAQAVAEPQDMIGRVDAVVIARDDPESHAALALPFLDQGLPVFVDKPLTLDRAELASFLPHLRAGRLMSCSGFRYAVELDGVRAGIGDYGRLRAFRAAVVNDWERYAVHMLEPVFTLTPARPVAVQRLPAAHGAYAIALDDGSLVSIDVLGASPAIFNLAVIGQAKVTAHDLRDNFSAFRRALHAFIGMVRDRVPPIPAEDTETLMRTLIAGRAAAAGGPPVPVRAS